MTAHECRMNAQAATLVMVEACELESLAQTVRLLAADVLSITGGLLARQENPPEVIESHECVRRAEGEMRAAVEILGEMRARLWNERAARVRREVENLNTGRERP